MSKVTIAGDVNGTGVFTIAAPNGNTNRTLTLPDEAGTILTTATAGVPIGGPAFSAYASGTTTLANVTSVKVLFAAEEFDTNSNFASSTFTPTVAGYYQVNANAYIQGGSSGAGGILVYKNGSLYKAGPFSPFVSGVGIVMGISALVYCNGSTDYVEIYAYQNTGVSATAQALQTYTWFQGAMVRSAT